ncbi:RMT2 [Candida theae]|uniref:Arginine N-methyltransferase 2 n=1 Tax=Candida theae TaxID=1198502 RepID=A0AAD5BEG1_9ASCO|nr:RMT2 [Candida theae]KAI5957813.1 RMT2 [Candida theae]
MSDLHDLCKFPQRPITGTYIDNLKYYLKNGIPATYTVEEAYNYTNGIEQEEPTTTTTPLHLICTHVPKDVTQDEVGIVCRMVEILFEYGAGWSFTDINNNTPGCILIARGLDNLPVYQQIVDAGVRAELLLRKVSEYDMEVISDTEDLDHEAFVVKTAETEDKDDAASKDEEGAAPAVPVAEANPPHNTSINNTLPDDEPNAPSQNQQSYLNTKLEYVDDALVTKDRKDGVMMSWETDIMQLGANTLFKGAYIEQDELDSEVNILNIGFGMGIIDTMIQEKTPTMHYICEAHPDVLAKLETDGWFAKPNVKILAGRWQDELPKLLNQGVFFNGIYYDTFSEHYSDMLDLFDMVVGLLKPHGVFSFFNGLGADRQVIYQVYRKLVELDLANYGLECKFVDVDVPKSLFKRKSKRESGSGSGSGSGSDDDDGDAEDGSVWDNVKRSYWSCPTYYHPEVKFIDF